MAWNCPYRSGEIVKAISLWHFRFARRCLDDPSHGFADYTGKKSTNGEAHYEIIWNNFLQGFVAPHRASWSCSLDAARDWPLPLGESFGCYLAPAGISASPHRYPKVMPRVAFLHPTILYKNKLLRADVFLRFREDLRRSAANDS